MEKFVLNSPRLPARLDVRQVADLLGFQEYEIGILMSIGHLRPLGNPAQNGRKWFATVEIERCAQNPDWLDKATKAVSKSLKSKALRSAVRSCAKS